MSNVNSKCKGMIPWRYARTTVQHRHESYWEPHGGGMIDLRYYTPQHSIKHPDGVTRLATNYEVEQQLNDEWL